MIIIIIIIIMKTINRRSSHGHHGSKSIERTLTWIARIHSHTFINTVTTTLCEAPAHILQHFKLNFILKVPDGGGGWGANRSTRRTPPTACPLISSLCSTGSSEEDYPPDITCPDDVSVSASSGRTSARAYWTEPRATDRNGGTPT